MKLYPFNPVHFWKTHLSLEARRKLTILFPGSIIFLVILLTVMILIPQIELTRARWDQLATDKRTVQLLTQKAQILSSIQPEALRQDLKSVDRILPSDIDVATVLTMVEGIAQESGVSITSLNVKPNPSASDSARPSESGQTLQFALSLSGNPPNIEQLLKLTESASPFVSLSTVQIDFSTSGLAQTNLAFVVHGYRLPQDLAGVDVPFPTTLRPREDTSQLSTFKSYETVNLDAFEASGTPRRKNLFRL